MIKIRRTKNGKEFYFTVHARNGKVLVTSETYRRKRNLNNGIGALEEVMFYNGARVIDLTQKVRS